MMDTKAEEGIGKPRRQWVLMIVIVVSLALGFIFSQIFHSAQGLAVTFHNSSEEVIESIQLDFGSSDTQSRIQAFRIPAGQERLLFLNHEPGMGFNVLVKYRNGAQQEFCALRGDEQSAPVLYLHP
ncbi:hypothetical protein [Amphritea sp.]|uniref:hypothetical protein n=1 Tax=Amphritea sp. TaxID=1872502 RepID=UPI0025C1C274|nr:hypothetical protein [Amphritea sp.]